MALKTDLKILVVDDMSTMRKLIKMSLMKIGLTNLHDADDGATAWPLIQSAKAAGEPFDLILSDWNMPQMTGLDLLKHVRSAPELNKIPFIIITGEEKDGYKEAAVSSGVDYFMYKPINDITLLANISSLFPSN